jgi:tetratricopeptide (TPR) repeat protein
LPTILRSAYDPGRLHLGPEGKLAVLAPGEKSTDPYKATPDELYARGKGLFDTGRLAEAAGPLESLWDSYTLREDVAKDAARMLLTIHIKNYDPRRVVKYFEVLKEKSPELVIPFEDIRVVGRAYADIGEHERAYLVWRATAEASYLEDARVGEVLRQRAKTLEGLAFLLELWREYPNGPSYQTDFFGLSSILGNLATRAYTETELRRELARAEVTRTDLLAQQIRLIQIFLCLSPENPIADEASLALVGAFLDLEDFKRVVALAERFAGLYPRSRFLDSFLYSQALGHFHLGEYDPAVKLAERIAAATYKDESGVDQPSPNKWEAIYILGQIHDARHQSAKAVEYYTQVADRFGDAASAVASLSRKELKLPEVAVVRPKGGPEQARVEPGPSGVGLRSIQLEAPKADGTPDLDVSYRNLSEIDLKVYAVDLMRLYLTRRNLDGITGIDLAGIQPLVEQTIKLGSGDDYEDMTKGLDLPLTKEGAYLVMARGENLYASGIVLITPLELEVLEEAQAGRVRVRVRDARTKAFLPKVQVKVIGSNNARFLSGETDLRGVFVAEGVQGVVTAVARKDLTQYAFYRGKSFVGQPPAPTAAAPEQVPAEGKAEQAQQGQGLDKNLKDLNFMNSTRQLERLQERYNLPAPSGGVQVEQAK